MTAISYHDTVNDVPAPDAWGNGPFARRDWFSLLEAHGARPHIALASQGSEIACLPLKRGRNGLESLTNWYAFTWSPMLAAGPLSDLARDLARRTRRVNFDKLDEAHADQLVCAFRDAGWWVDRHPCDTNHILPVAGRSFDAFLATRPGPLRTTLRRKAGKVAVKLATIFDPSDWAAYEEIYADSWKPEEGDPALLRSFAEMESAAGRYRMALARHEGEPVGAQFWTVDGDVACIHKLAHRESAARLSPGTTLTAALMRRVIDVDGVALVDFGTGDDAYKRDWMEARRTRWRLVCLRPASPRNWPAMARAMLRKLVSRTGAG